MKRAFLQGVAETKLADAQILIGNGRFSNSYYLAGYAVEIGLKACIAKQFTAEDIPDKRFVNDIYKHNLIGLVGLAGLAAEHQKQSAADANFAANWGVVAEWNPEVRYEHVDKFTAHAMLLAITDSKSGVFPWIKAHW